MAVVHELQALQPNLSIITGTFNLFNDDSTDKEQTSLRSKTSAVKSCLELDVAAGGVIALEANTGGVGGDSLTFTADHDGLAEATCVLTFAAPAADELTATMDTGGTAGNDWKIHCLSSADVTAGSEVVIEDATAKTITVVYEASTSTTAQICTAIATATVVASCTGGAGGITPDENLYDQEFSGGTAATYCEVSGVNTHLHYTSATTTVAAAVAAINAPSTGTSLLTARALLGTTDLFANGDAVVETSLQGGDNRGDSDVTGLGFSVQKTAQFQYTITLDETWGDIICVHPRLRLESTDDCEAEMVSYTAATRKIVVRTKDLSAGAEHQPDDDVGKKVDLIVLASNFY